MKTIITLAAAFIISTLAVCQNSDINYIEGELMVLFQNDVEIEGWLTSQNASSDGNFIVRQRLSQSLNLWLEDPTYNTLTSMHFYAWSKGLKTGIYYLRRRGKHQAQQFTIEPEKDEETPEFVSQEEEICEMCSA